MVQCSACSTAKAMLKRPKTGRLVCKECFFQQFEDEIHQTVVTNNLFRPGMRVAIAASGGKDSTVLAHTMTLLNKKYNYGVSFFLLSVDEGISGYRDDSLETVKRNREQYKIPLEIVSYQDLYGWTMDAIVKEIGRTNNCTFCGVFRRQALDRGAVLCKADMIVTGHNADDVAETVLMNILRGDINRLGRCVEITTGKDSSLPRSKPFKYTYEKEIVMYAYYKDLDYFSTECIYSPFAYRGYAREYLKNLEKISNVTIIDIIRSAEHFHPRKVTVGKKVQVLGKCQLCGHISSNKICKACSLLRRLNRGKPKVAVDSGARKGDMPTGKSTESKTNDDSTSCTSRAAGPSSAIGDRAITQTYSVGWDEHMQKGSGSASSDNDVSAASSKGKPKPNAKSLDW